MKNTDGRTKLTVIIPAFAACAYLLGAALSKNRSMKTMFMAMSSFMAGLLIKNIFSYILFDGSEE